MRRIWLFWVVVLAAAILRVFLISTRSVVFAFDMGRDLLWAKDISFYHIPTLIGPAGSIWGVYFGPFWFYILSIPLRLTNGNPLSAVYTTMTLVVLAGILAYYFFRNTLKGKYAFLLSIILLFNASMIGTSLFAFHANVLPLLTLLLIYFCYLAIVKKTEAIAIALFFASLMFHADPAPAVVFSAVPFVIYFAFKLYKRKNRIKVILFSIFAYLVPFIPQIIFELRNNFIEVKSLASYFGGNNPSLSGQLPIVQRVINRVEIFYSIFKSGFSGDNNFVALIFLVIILTGLSYFLKRNNSRNLSILFKLLTISTVTIFLIFTFVVTVEVKGWYVCSIPVLYAFFITFALIGFEKYKKLYLVFLAVFLLANTYQYFVHKNKLVNDPASLSNQLEAIDTIYQDSNSRDFSVYTYTPAIYDFSYQYLFWWIAVAKHKGLPADFAYLPNQPEYVRNKTIYAKKQVSTSTIYLIIENAEGNQFYTRRDWLNNFKNYNLIWERDINSALTIQKREMRIN